MAWMLKFEENAAREIRKLDPQIRRRIRNYLEQRVLSVDDPRKRGKPLRGSKSRLWRYRVGDYRIVCEIQDNELLILVIRIGHRRNVYQ